MTQPQQQPVSPSASPPSPTLAIGVDVFALSPMPAMRSFVLQPRVVPIATEVVTLAFGVARELMDDGATNLDLQALLASDVDLSKVSEAIGKVCAKLPSQELDGLTRDLLAGSTMNGTPLFAPVAGGGDPIDVLLRGRTLDIWRLLWHAVKVNYWDFFVALGASGRRQSGASPSAGSSTSPTSGHATA